MKQFKKVFFYLDIEELIEYYCIFEGYKNLKVLTTKDNLFENILEHILKQFNNLKKNYTYCKDEAFQKDIEKFLHRLAIGNQKAYSVYKNDISHYRGKNIYKFLFEKKIIKKELSREKINFQFKKKKEYRGYQIENRIKFTKNFDRFWYMFIYPFQKELQQHHYDNAFLYIKENLDRFISIGFEDLANLLLKKRYSILEYGAYWDKYIELDLFAKTKDGILFAGECKWKNHKVNSNILNKLKKKCEKVGFKVDYYVLFSKRGFSKELLKQKDKNLILIELKDFEELF